jgi:amino acid transporter
MNRVDKGGLRREMGLFALIAFGVGDILGAGIYALVGEIAGLAGTASWLAFAIALAVASLTALSYAELSSRFPRSGGESYYCQQAFRRPTIALLVGWLVLCSGIVSLATVSRAFAGYVSQLISASPSESVHIALVVTFLLLVGGINFWGIRQSSRTNIVCTSIEVSGLLLVIVTGFVFLAGEARDPIGQLVVEKAALPGLPAIGQAAALAFFAFIGFEDMVNVAEEVQLPHRNLPIAIIVAVLVAGTIYIIVVWVATAVVPPAEIAASNAPLVTVVERTAPQMPIWIFTIIALFAVANTGLLNFIMASRLLYGMSNQKLMPAKFGRVHAITGTPHWSIAAVLLIALILAVSGSLGYLAGTTSVLLLGVFCSVNAGLLQIKRREVDPRNGFQIPIWVPALAAAACVVLIGFAQRRALMTGGLILFLGAVLSHLWTSGDRFEST